MVFVSNASKMHFFLECHYLKSLFIIVLAFKHLYLYIKMVMDEKLHSASILLKVSCSTHSSGIHFYFNWKNYGKTGIEYKILKYQKLKMI